MLNNCVFLVLKQSLCELLADCGELNQMLKKLILILHKDPPKPGHPAGYVSQTSVVKVNQMSPTLLNQISSIDHMISKKQKEIDDLINGLNSEL